MTKFHCSCGKVTRRRDELCQFTTWIRCKDCGGEAHEENRGGLQRPIDWSLSKEFNFDKETVSEINAKTLKMAENYPNSPLNDTKLHRDLGVTRKQYAEHCQRTMVNHTGGDRRFTERDFN